MSFYQQSALRPPCFFFGYVVSKARHRFASFFCSRRRFPGRCAAWRRAQQVHVADGMTHCAIAQVAKLPDPCERRAGARCSTDGKPLVRAEGESGQGCGAHRTLRLLGAKATLHRARGRCSRGFRNLCGVRASTAALALAWCIRAPRDPLSFSCRVK